MLPENMKFENIVRDLTVDKNVFLRELAATTPPPPTSMLLCLLLAREAPG